MNHSPIQRGRPRTIDDALQHCAQSLDDSDAFFGHGTDSAWDEAVQLVLSVAGLPLDSDESVLLLPLDDAVTTRLLAMLQRRVEEHVPLPYLLGLAWFAGLEFFSDRRAIIPRSPIAELIRKDFKPWYSGPPPRRVLDLCCGGGCIGLATAHYHATANVDLADLDALALDLARENRQKLNLDDRVNIVRSDLFTGLGGNRYDLILSNPPYVDSRDLASMPAEFQHEPELALGSGTDGLDLTRIILAQAASHLTDDGLLILEVGNSWEALERAYPRVPFTWLEFEMGGHGVFALTAKELQQYSASFAG